ncbi:MAG: YifB family Mg chelatase-like AAA ATPase [Actinomycetota bacterium]|nr:YifB family Mg chelatase-like AAA ATPase [Actinomycetota bacterium]
MLATVPSATLLGVDGWPITVEVHTSNGLPGFAIVGLPDASCREARDRVRAALLSSQLPWENRRVTVNLAPTGMRKSGAGLDLPIAVGMLVAAKVLRPSDIEGMAFVGELGLDGSIRAVHGVLSMVDAVQQPIAVVPEACYGEASALGRHEVRTARGLSELVDSLRRRRWSSPPPPGDVEKEAEPDLADVRGQALGRTAVEVSAAGGHHLLMVGPPGAGKSMLARRLPGLLPSLTPAEAFATTRIHSAAGLPLPARGVLHRPPLRAPHHGASAVSLIGGGSSTMRPGEISCAHFGVLFLDELAEFPAAVMDTLRQPLEEGVIRVCRARASVTFPAQFLLVAAMNPCPCGEGMSPGSCRCGDQTRLRYSRRISGPLLDRFDLRVTVDRPEIAQLLPSRPGDDDAEESTATVAGRVARARQLAADRGVRCNAELPAAGLDDLAPLTSAARAVLEARLRQGRLSARGLHRVRRVARTLADLGGRPGPLDEEDICGALVLRSDPFCATAVPA